ncbi:hypothetical protein AgCh_034159 [Apium graveolens]
MSLGKYVVYTTYAPDLKSSAGKPVLIEKGKGIPLKDISNVICFAKLTESKSLQAMCRVYAAVSYICIGDAESSSQALDLIGPVYSMIDSFVGVREKTFVLFAYGFLLMKQQNLQEVRLRLANGLQTTYVTLGNLQLVEQYLTVLGNLALSLHDTGQAREILRINDGPYKPTKLSVAVVDQPVKTIPKEKGDYIPEDISSIAKDARVRNLLHSAIDNVMSNKVIGCNTAKEIWDALETRCQGTEAIKKNRKTIHTQEYEHFDSKSDESLTDLYDRFAELLNDLSLVDKEYVLEDSNLKFLLALPENWDLKCTIIRDNYDLAETTLDEIYGMLKTHELEMDQRSKRHGRKSKTVALKAEEESPKVVVSKRGKGKALIIQSD